MRSPGCLRSQKIRKTDRQTEFPLEKHARKKQGVKPCFVPC